MINIKKLISKVVNSIMNNNNEEDLFEALNENGVYVSSSKLLENIHLVKESLIKNSYPTGRSPKWIKSNEYCKEAFLKIAMLSVSDANRIVPENINIKINETIKQILSFKGMDLSKLGILTEEIKLCPKGKDVDGVLLPSECFAYIPDIENPLTWDIQILNKEGHFVETNILNILPTLDVSKVQKVKDKYIEAKLKHSIAEKGERALCDNFILLDEKHVKELTKGRLKITVISPGLTKDGLKFYPRQVLSEAMGLYEGVKMFMNHSTDFEDFERPERDLNAWIGIIENVHLGSDGEILADAVIIDPAFKEKVELLETQGKLDKLGISHTAIGEFEFIELDDNHVMNITNIVSVRSVDFVTEGNAGSAVHMLESLNTDLDVINLKQLVEARPDLIEQLNEQNKVNLEENSMNWEEIAKDLKEKIATLGEANKKEISELEAKLDEALKKVEEMEKESLIKTAQKELDECLKDSELPEEAIELIKETFKDSTDFSEIKESVEKQISVMNSLKLGVKVKSLGRSTKESSSDDSDSEEGKASLIEVYTTSFINQGFSESVSKEKAEAKYRLTKTK